MSDIIEVPTIPLPAPDELMISFGMLKNVTVVSGIDSFGKAAAALETLAAACRRRSEELNEDLDEVHEPSATGVATVLGDIVGTAEEMDAFEAHDNLHGADYHLESAFEDSVSGSDFDHGFNDFNDTEN